MDSLARQVINARALLDHNGDRLVGRMVHCDQAIECTFGSDAVEDQTPNTRCSSWTD
jgi:hypothetical protein